MKRTILGLACLFAMVPGVALAGHPPPAAGATIACSPDPGTAPATVTCTATVTGCTSSDGYLFEVQWGDGSANTFQSSGLSQSHDYSSGGAYTVKGTVPINTGTGCTGLPNTFFPTTTETLH